MRDIKQILEKQKELVRPDKESLKIVEKYLHLLTDNLKRELRKNKTRGDIFIGGSFAKGTLVKKEDYDIDIFLRFDLKHKILDVKLEKIIREVSKALGAKYELVHGSRDYFRIIPTEIRTSFEIIPVAKIKRPREAQNVTDLSYFHVPYIRKYAKKFGDDIRLAKAFCHAQGVYGAESYIQGFSGHALECLVIYYKGFLPMLRGLAKAKDRVIADPARHYKRAQDVMIGMSESKLHSPIILVDPTFKERNALASLSKETFEKFQKAAGAFLSKPSMNYFVEKKLDIPNLKEYARKQKAEFIHVVLETDRQAGDIAGTKLKKFHYWIEKEISKSFILLKHEFQYDGLQKANLYLVVRSKKEIIHKGPPLEMSKHVRVFMKEHKKTFKKAGRIWARIPITDSGKSSLNNFLKDTEHLHEMGITRFRVND